MMGYPNDLHWRMNSAWQCEARWITDEGTVLRCEHLAWTSPVHLHQAHHPDGHIVGWETEPATEQ